MSANPRQSNGHARREAVKWLKATGDHVCWICHLPIDMALEYPNPWSWSCDEAVPVSLGGSPYERANLREAHLHCNCSRGDGTRRARSILRDAPQKIENSRVW